MGDSVSLTLEVGQIKLLVHCTILPALAGFKLYMTTLFPSALRTFSLPS